MLVRCVRQKPTDSQVEDLGEYYKKYSLKNDSHLTVDKTYLVLGLVMNTCYPRMGKGAWVTLQCDYGHITSYPFALFEVIDGTVDPEWTVRSRPDGIVDAQPELLHEERFAENYLDGIPEAVKAFRELLKRMEQRKGKRGQPESLSEIDCQT